MAKRTTKAQTVIWEAEARLNVARVNLSLAEAKVCEARAVVNALLDTYDALKIALARVTPRRMPKQEPVKKGKTTKPVCDSCSMAEDHPNHDRTHIASHPFASGAVKRSSRKGVEQAFTQNTGEGTEHVLTVGRQR